MNRRDSLEYNLSFAKKKKTKSKYTTLVLFTSAKIYGFRISIKLKRGSVYSAIFFTNDFPALSDIQNFSMKPPHGF